MIKTDSLGKRQWDKTFGGDSSDAAYSVQQTSEGEYIIAGETSSFGAGKRDAWLIKTDASGVKQWDKTFGGSGWDEATSVQPTSEGKYIIAGTNESFNAGDAWLIKTDASGNKEWEKTFGGSAFDGATSVQQTNDGGYIIAGWNGSFDPGNSYAWLIKTDASGSKQWDKTFGRNMNEQANGVQQTNDGGYIVAGWTGARDAGVDDAWLIKTDASGKKQWNKTLGGSKYNTAHCVYKTSDGGYIVVWGPESLFFDGNSDVYLTRFAPDETRQPVSTLVTAEPSYSTESKPIKVTSPPLIADIDVNIPSGKAPNPNALAVILGVENYSRVPHATYARNDAAVFKEYAVKVLGVPDDGAHTYCKTDNDITGGEMRKLFTGRDSWLSKRTHANTDVYIYYAGHGSPGIEDQEPYLIPYDGDPNYPRQTGINLNELYSELAKLPARSVTVFLDACFSGTNRENQTLLADSRPVVLRIKDPMLASDKLTVFAAASSNQISSGYPEKKHGLFTYFLLKRLGGEADLNKDKTITVEELENYLTTNVSKEAGLLDREQTPRVFSQDKSRILVKY